MAPLLLWVLVENDGRVAASHCTCGSCGEGDKRAVNKMLLFSFCSGRLTASVIKSAARTNHAMPSPHLVKRICYPEVSRHHPSCLKISKTRKTKKDKYY